MRENKVRVYHHPPSQLYLLVTDRVPEIRFLGSQNQLKNGLIRQVEQGFSLQIFGIFDYLLKVEYVC